MNCNRFIMWFGYLLNCLIDCEPKNQQRFIDSCYTEWIGHHCSDLIFVDLGIIKQQLFDLLVNIRCHGSTPIETIYNQNRSCQLSKLLAIRFKSVFNFMVCSVLIVVQFFYQCTTQIQIMCSCNVKDSDQAVRQFHFKH